MTAREIAAALGRSVQAVHQRARKEKWPCRVLNRRGDRLFFYESLPADVRQRIEAAPGLPSGVPTLAEMARGYLNFWANLFRGLGRAFVWACEHQL